MRLLFVADGRSPTALNWIQYFTQNEYEVHLVSTFPCQINLDLASLSVIPVAFSGLKSPIQSSEKGAQKRGIWGDSLVQMRTRIRQWLGPLTLPIASRHLKQLIHELKPDLVHAMRIPYEGMLAALAEPPMPLLVSVWGNDFTLHAGSTPWMRHYTELTLKRADALHTDCRRDLTLARKWGYALQKLGAVLPGAGGIQLDLFYPPRDQDHSDVWETARDRSVINPRGVRAYVRNDTFFKAIPLVLKKAPQTRFYCPTMAGQPQAESWVRELDISESVELLPQIPRIKMADLFRACKIVVSPTTHDGTPNTLLEAMACGCLPIVGDIESLHEWIEPGMNGLMFDPNKPAELSDAILAAFADTDLIDRAFEINQDLIAKRADYQIVMQRVEDFYNSILNK